MATTSDDHGVRERVASTRFRAVRWFEEIDSTNRYLLDEARRGAGDGLVAVADRQTAGRGRLDRAWEAPARSSLLASALVRPSVEEADRPLLLLAAALAACEAVRATCGVAVALKWPNDLTVDDRKLAGLLAESVEDAVVIGFGCNLRWERFPEHLSDRATAVNLAGGSPPPPEDLLVAWLLRLHERVSEVEGGHGGRTVADAAASMSTLGRSVRVELGDRAISGRAQRLTPAGHLVLVGESGDEHEVATGDVVHLRDA